MKEDEREFTEPADEPEPSTDDVDAGLPQRDDDEPWFDEPAGEPG